MCDVILISCSMATCSYESVNCQSNHPPQSYKPIRHNMIWVENGNAWALLGIYDVKSHFKLSERLGLAYLCWAQSWANYQRRREGNGEEAMVFCRGSADSTLYPHANNTANHTGLDAWHIVTSRRRNECATWSILVFSGQVRRNFILCAVRFWSLEFCPLGDSCKEVVYFHWCFCLSSCWSDWYCLRGNHVLSPGTMTTEKLISRNGQATRFYS